MVCKETVHELAYGICPLEAGTYETQLGGIEKAAVDDRLLHHIERCAADIVEAVAEGSGYECLDPQLLIAAVNLISRHLHRRRCTCTIEG